MPSITVKSISFDDTSFRKLANITIEFASRVTVIAGHNGIGKSTILALLGNNSGLTGEPKRKSYLNRLFQANIFEILHLDYEREYLAYKQQKIPLPAPTVSYEIDGVQLVKKSSITGRRDTERMRVVPRNEPWRDLVRAGVRVGKDAKVPLPTLYLGMTRMLPVGESNPDWVKNALDKTIDQVDADFIAAFINEVIHGTNLQSAKIITQSIKNTTKIGKHPEYPYSAKCVSLGQDSLSSIATAVASFNMLKREWKDYPGGLLIIDEIDAGFHPHAQSRLMAKLKNEAKKLNLQIVATTHSINLIEAVHPDNFPLGPGGKRVDSVVYLTDTIQPRLASGYTLAHIRGDMTLTPPTAPARPKKKKLKVYLEDPEAEKFFTKLLTRALIKQIKDATGYELTPIGLRIGCNNLMGLHKADRHFLKVLMVVDGDATLPPASEQTANIIRLPGGADGRGRGFNPERTIYEFINELIKPGKKYQSAWSKLHAHQLSRDQLRAIFLSKLVNIGEREAAKKWMTDHLDYIEQYGIIECWMLEHRPQVVKFEDALVEAAKIVAARQPSRIRV